MNTVIFETGKAMFHFELPAVSDSLQDCCSCGRGKDATDLINILEASSVETRGIPSEKWFFGYILLDLLGKKRGSLFCKICQKTYPAEEVQSHRIGLGDNPLAVIPSKKGGGIRKIFGRKIKRVGIMGGKRFECPEGYELIALLTWMS